MTLPLLPVQETLDLLTRATPGSPAYHVARAVRVSGPLDPDEVAAALVRAVDRHPALRVAVPGSGAQRVEAGVPAVLHHCADGADVSMAAAARRLEQLAREPFDPATAPLWRAELIRLGPEDHVLGVVAHALVLDTRSVDMLLAELLGVPAADPQPYQEAVAAARGRRDREADRIRRYWRDRLAGAPALALPTDRPRPARLRLDAGLVTRAAPAVAAPVLLAAVTILLNRLTGQSDLVIGVAPPARTGALAAAVDLLPVRLTVPPRATGTRLLADAAAALDELAGTDVLAFADVLDAARPVRDPSRSPLFQVGVAVRPDPLTGPDRQAVAWPVDRGAGRLELLLELGGGVLALEHATAVLDRAGATRLLDQGATVLAGLTADPDRPVAKLPVDPPGTPIRLGSPRRRDSGDTVAELVFRQAARTPQAEALVAGAQRVSYRELTRRASRLAHRLREHGVGPDVPVGLMLERSADHPVGILGILAAGGAYLPIDLRNPPARVATVLADAAPPLVLTQRELAARLPAGTPTLILDDPAVRADLAARPDRTPAPLATPDSLGYVIHTSGSTGRPKGVAVEQRSLVNLLEWLATMPRGTVPGRGRTLHFTTIAFDVAFQELFGTWTRGDALVVADEQTRVNPERLLRLLTEERVTALHLPFAALEQLADAARLLGIGPVDVRDVYTAGEQLKSTEAVRVLFARMPGARLRNQYGPTETSVIVTDHPLDADPARWPELPPIGRPIDGVTAYVLDADRRPVPAGALGTLHIGGAAVARGYLHRPELTAERFLPLFGDRVYDTGDLVRIDANGELRYAGRLDTQVKTAGGHRVELGEIEAALTSHPAVAAAVVADREVGEGRALVAWWRPSAEAGGETGAEMGAELAAHLAAVLPSYSVPVRYGRVDRFPLTASGKVDRRALPVPPPVATGDRQAGEPPGTPWEELAAEAIRARLGTGRLRRTDRFLDAGGHSLSAVGVVAEIAARSGVRLPVETLLRNPTVAELGTAVQTAVLDRIGPAALAALLADLEEVPGE